MRRIPILACLLPACLADASYDRGAEPIVRGAADTEHSAVGVLSAGRGRCTATLVAPRVVIGVKHCILPSMAAGDISFSLGEHGEVPAGRGVQRFYPGGHAGYEHQRDDLLAVVLDSDPAVPDIHHIPFRRAPMDEDLEERTATIVGFGETAAGAGDFGTRRVGETTIYDIDSKTFDTRRDEGQSTNCGGDSGGPVIVDGEVAGIIVGSAWGNCRRYAIHTRVDRYTDTIDLAILWAAAHPLPEEAPSPATAGAAQEEEGDDEIPEAEVQPNAACAEGWCVGGDGLCDDWLDCCATDSDCDQSVTCECDVSWGCDDCWCEPVEECV